MATAQATVAPRLPAPPRGTIVVVAVVCGLVLAGVSFALHRDDPIQADARVIVDRGADQSATARARVMVETIRPRLPSIVPDAERAAITRLINEPTIDISVDAVDAEAARSGADAVVAEVLELGRIDWEASMVARRLTAEATLTALIGADDPAPRQQANLEAEIAQIDAELAAGGNFATVLGETTTRSSGHPVRDALMIFVVAAIAGVIGEYLVVALQRAPTT